MLLKLLTVFYTMTCIASFNNMIYASDLDIYFLKGEIAESKGSYESAVAEYEKILSIDSKSVEAYYRIANIYRTKLKQTTKAIEIYQKGLKYLPNNFRLNRGIMYSYFEHGDLDSGIKYYKLASNLRGESDRLYFPRESAIKIIKNMNIEEVINFCRDYIKINPSDIILREILSEKYIKKRDYKNAKIEYEAMLKYGYDQGYVYFGLAVCEYYLGGYEKALDYLTKAKNKGEDVPASYFNMVKDKMKTGD